MLNNETIRFDQKQTIAAYERQIQNLQQLLQIQIEESNHSQSHAVLLNQEIDALRKIIQEKTMAIHDMQRQLRRKQDYCSELESKHDQTKIDRLAFFELEQQNLQLLEGLREKIDAVEKLEIENRYLREQREDRLLLEENKAKKALELEISFPFERSQLQVRLDQAQDTNNLQAMRISQLEAQVQSLTLQLEQSREKFGEHLMRTKQSEYKILLELDAQQSENRQLDFDRRKIEQRSQALTRQAQELTAQLENSTQQTENLQTIFSTAIDTLEHDYHQLAQKEKILERENQLLQFTQQVQQEIIVRASDPKRNTNLLSQTVSSLPLTSTISTATEGTMAMVAGSMVAESQGSTRKAKQSGKEASRTALTTTHVDNVPLSSPGTAIDRRSPLRKFDSTGSQNGSRSNHSSRGNSRVTTAVPRFQPPTSNQAVVSSPAPTPKLLSSTVPSTTLTASTSASVLQLQMTPGSSPVPTSKSYSVPSSSALQPLQLASPRQTTPTSSSHQQQHLSQDVLSAFSPTTPAGNSASNVETGLINLQMNDTVFGAEKLRPQAEILALDLKNTLLHRYLQLVCRCHEAFASVPQLRAQPKKYEQSLSDTFDSIDRNRDSESPGEQYPFTSAQPSPTKLKTLGLSVPLSLELLQEINLSNCTLVDKDMHAVIDWLRTMPTQGLLRHLRRLFLQNNQFTADVLLQLFAWIFSWSALDFDCLRSHTSAVHSDESLNTTQRYPLEIDLKYNKISFEGLWDCVQYMSSMLQGTVTSSGSQNLGIGNGQEIAFVGLLDPDNDRKLLFHAKYLTQKSGGLHESFTASDTKPSATFIALSIDVNKQRGDHTSRLLRQSRQFKDPKLTGSQLKLSIREPLANKMQTFATESIVPVLPGDDGINSNNRYAKERDGIPRDLVMKHDFVG